MIVEIITELLPGSAYILFPHFSFDSQKVSCGIRSYRFHSMCSRATKIPINDYNGYKDRNGIHDESE